MQDTCLPQNYVNCIGKVKVCGCRRFRESVLYGQCLFCSSPCLPLSYFLLVRLSCSFPPEVLSRISLSAFCILLSFPPLQFSPVSSVCLPLSFLCFIIFSYYNVRARVWVWRDCKFCKFARFLNLKCINMKDFLYFPSMTKGSLALLYFPGSNPRIATRHLMRWINGCPPLMEELSATGYYTSQKVFTSRQVTLINRHLGSPGQPCKLFGTG